MAKPLRVSARPRTTLLAVALVAGLTVGCSNGPATVDLPRRRVSAAPLVSPTPSIYPVPVATPPRPPKTSPPAPFVPVAPTSPTFVPPVPPVGLASPSPNPDAPRSVALTKGKVVTTTFTIAKNTLSASIAANWTEAAKVNATLRSPGGGTLNTSIGKVLVRRPEGGTTWYLDEPAPGKYQLQLKATKSDTTASVLFRQFDNPGPTTTAATDVDGDTVTFTAVKNKNITGYLWDFGDSTASLGQEVAHTYATPGTYTAQLMATNASGAFTLIPVPTVNII